MAFIPTVNNSSIPVSSFEDEIGNFRFPVQEGFPLENNKNSEYLPGFIDNESSVGDIVIDGLKKMSNDFSKINNLMSNAFDVSSSGSQFDITGYQNSNDPSSNNKFEKEEYNSFLEEVKKFGIENYKKELGREIQFTNAEFETHIMTVASQNMSSTLKSLLTQGG